MQNLAEELRCDVSEVTASVQAENAEARRTQDELGKFD